MQVSKDLVGQIPCAQGTGKIAEKTFGKTLPMKCFEEIFIYQSTSAHQSIVQ